MQHVAAQDLVRMKQGSKNKNQKSKVKSQKLK